MKAIPTMAVIKATRKEKWGTRPIIHATNGSTMEMIA